VAVHPPQLRDRVRALAAAGRSDAAIATELGLARTTVRDIRAPRSVLAREVCPRCWRPTRPVRFAPGDYAELLGFYLGDGHISTCTRTQRLRIACTLEYPQLTRDLVRQLRRNFPGNRVTLVNAQRAKVDVSVYSSHLSCLFPQHGPGRKHDRPIALEPWQADLVREAPWAFLRGLMHSDGCFFINRTGRYGYLSAQFCNVSRDVRRLFTDTCDLVGVRYTTNGKLVWVRRRDSVARFAWYVGLKC